MSLIVPQTVGPASIPLKQSDNNNLTNVKMGTPFKPAPMAQGNMFSLGRAMFKRSNLNANIGSWNPLNPNSNTTTIVNNGIATHPGSNHTANINGWVASTKMKKCSGDSADYIRLKSSNAIGKSSMTKVNAPLSFAGRDQTSVKTAVARCRGGGCVAPAKKVAYT